MTTGPPPRVSPSIQSRRQPCFSTRSRRRVVYGCPRRTLPSRSLYQSPYVNTAIFTVVGMTWVGTLVVSRGVGAWRLHSASSINWHSFEEDLSHTLSCLPIFRRTRLRSENPLKILAALFRQRDACTLVLAVSVRNGPNTQDRAGRLVAATGHLFEHVMTTYPPPGIAGEVAETSSNTQCAFRLLWKKYGYHWKSRPLSFGRETHSLCWPGKPARVRTFQTKLGVSWRRLATTSRT